MPLLAIASAVSRTTFSLSPLHANLFQLFHPMGGVRANPLSRACDQEEASTRSEIKNNVRAEEKPKRIAVFLFKPRSLSNHVPGHSNSFTKALNARASI